MKRFDMEERDIFNESEYIEGFNLGYRMTKDFPELAEFLDYTRGQNDKLDGLKDGRQQFLEEKLQEKTNEQSKDSNYPSWLKVDRFENLNKAEPEPNRDIDLDRD
ncbi:hypothetical protein [Pedobacter jamesrossensis]|uniref:hypothetical protein n=1 Tax=Pedobacter jamesrossensis TaxID=1908238 RepID=UPI003619D572